MATPCPEAFALGLNLFAARFGGFELGLRGGRPGFQAIAFRTYVGEFRLNPMNFPVAVL
jgi:hypothetical protein